MRKVLTTMAIAAVAAYANQAQAADLYGSIFSASTPLYVMNQATGAAGAAPNTGISSISDLASSGTNASVWGVASSTNTLYRFDAATAGVLATVPISGSNGVTGAPETIISLALNPSLNVLYGSTAASFGGFNDLFRINPATGAATLVGNLQIDKMYALAFNPADGFLYGASGEIGETSFLWKINPSNAAALSVGTLSTTGNFDLAFRPGDNKLFLASSGTGSLYTVDVLTAAETLVGPYGSALNIAGLAFAVPEPQTWALMAGGLLLMGRRVRASLLRQARQPGR